MADRTVTLRYTKWGGGPHWRFDLPLLGADQHGTWLAGPPGVPLQLRDEPPVTRRDWFVTLVPTRGDWIAFWNERSRFEIYVDVCGPPAWTPDRSEVTAVDLDLDVVRWRADGVTDVIDEDEFADHQVALGYPPEVIAGARATSDWLMEAVTTRREPFDRVGPGWLGYAISRRRRSGC